MSKKVCFIHTETTGLHEINNYKVYKKNLFGFARMVSLSWIIATRKEKDNFEIIKKEKFIIKPRCMNIPDDCVKYHGISQKIGLTKGTDIEVVLEKFIKDLVDVKVISSHGLDFHLRTLQAELVRYNRPVDFNKYLLLDTNSFQHGITPSTLTNISKVYLKKPLDDKGIVIDVICELFFKLYNDYETKILANN